VVPILWKELRSRMRGPGAPVMVTGYLALMAAVPLGVLRFAEARGGLTVQSIGEITVLLYGVLTGLQMLLVAFITPALTASAIAGERERQTLDLLLATGLPGWGILAGKLAAAMAYAVLLIVASVPIFSLVFAIGGVPYTVLLQVLVLQFVTALALGCAGLLISTLVRRSGVATAVAVGLTVLVFFGTLGIGALQQVRREVRVQQAVAVPALPAGGPGAPVPAVAVQPPMVVEDTVHLPSAFYVSPLAALVAAVVPPSVGSPFGPVRIGMARVPFWVVYTLNYVLLSVLLFGLGWAVLERRVPGAALRRRAPTD